MQLRYIYFLLFFLRLLSIKGTLSRARRHILTESRHQFPFILYVSTHRTRHDIS